MVWDASLSFFLSVFKCFNLIQCWWVNCMLYYITKNESHWTCERFSFWRKQHHSYVLQGCTDEAKHAIKNSEVEVMDSEVDVIESEVDVIDSEVAPQHSKTCAEEKKNLEHFWKITYPLTTSMTLFGQYFRSDHQMSNATRSARIWNKFFRYYSLSLVIVHWVNFARILTISRNKTNSVSFYSATSNMLFGTY